MKKIIALLLALCIPLSASACKTKITKASKNREPVELLQCIQPSKLNSLYTVSDSKVAVSYADYEKESTTVLLADINKDAVCCKITLDGVWDLKEQILFDGRFALCQRDTNTWKFLSSSLEELGEWNAENVDGFFSLDTGTYYFLRNNMLYRQSVSTGECSKVILPLDLRLSELTAFDAQNSILVMQFLLSPYSSECGTAVYDIKTGRFLMLQKDRYRAVFCKENMCLLSFDNEKMGYSVIYGDEDKFFFADADIFAGNVSDLYSISDSPYLIGIATGGSVLYSADKLIKSCPLSDFAVVGEMHRACYLPKDELLVGAAYQDGIFRIYVIDPTQLSFKVTSNVASVASPFSVDDTIAESYWSMTSNVTVAENLQDARRYADALEKKYGVHILLSSQCKEGAALCDMPVTLTDTMSADEEMNGICTMLSALDYSLALYPKGFMSQFRNGAGDGGLCFLLVAHIESNYNVAGCTYERYDWQYIALDVNTSYRQHSVICHELWHATENHIFSRDYTALPMDEWDALNPTGFSYTGYETRKDSTYPWFLYTSAPKDIRFVDNYACVSRQEERARIMEYFMTYEDEARILIQSPYIRKKLQIMCDAVRKNFDTTDWKNVRWEQLL